jgi:hypothetical protein
MKNKKKKKKGKGEGEEEKEKECLESHWKNIGVLYDF